MGILSPSSSTFIPSSSSMRRRPRVAGFPNASCVHTVAGFHALAGVHAVTRDLTVSGVHAVTKVTAGASVPAIARVSVVAPLNVLVYRIDDGKISR